MAGRSVPAVESLRRGSAVSRDRPAAMPGFCFPRIQPGAGDAAMTHTAQTAAPVAARSVALHLDPVWRTGLVAAAAWARPPSSPLLCPMWSSGAARSCLRPSPRSVRPRCSLSLFGRPPRPDRTRHPSTTVPGSSPSACGSTLWELTTAKLGWLPKPFFSPPQGLLNVYVVDWSRLLTCIGYTMRLWALGFGAGVAVGYVARRRARLVERGSATGACRC